MAGEGLKRQVLVTVTRVDKMGSREHVPIATESTEQRGVDWLSKCGASLPVDPMSLFKRYLAHPMFAGVIACG
jgi:hypothetical protein